MFTITFGFGSGKDYVVKLNSDDPKTVADFILDNRRGEVAVDFEVDDDETISLFPSARPGTEGYIANGDGPFSFEVALGVFIGRTLA